VLAFTAAKMIVNEPWLDPVFDGSAGLQVFARWCTYVCAVAGVLLLGWWTGRRREGNSPRTDSI
jgi:hypothetical protein